MPWKIVAPDGRSRNIHTPIHGFEHLFEDTNCFQEAPSTGGRPRSAVEIAGQPQHAQAPGKTTFLCTLEHPLNKCRRDATAYFSLWWHTATSQQAFT
jgi:hypothetical protein